jgi:predicted metal-dependent HD superfamily phosphohydrolase
MINPFKHYKKILEEYLHSKTIPFLENAWNEPHRKYHSINHLNEVLEYIEQNFNVHTIDYDSLILAAFFHDCYYNPRDNKNDEDESIKRFLSSFKDSSHRIRNVVVEMIESTKYRKVPMNYLTRMFWSADNAGFSKGYEKLLKNEKLIHQEFIHLPKKIYKKGRISFLKTNIGLFNSSVDKDLNKLIEYIKVS